MTVALSTPRSFTGALVALLLLTTTGCKSTQRLESRPPAAAVTIDGAVEEWAGVVKPVAQQRFSLGVQNDGTFLYVTLLTSDEGVTRQVLRSGLILWMDPAGGKEKAFGLHFPLGLAAGRPGERQARQPAPDRDAEALRQRFEASLGTLEVIGADGQRRRMAVDAAPGVEAHATYAYGTLTYEVKVPLQARDAFAYAVGAAPGTTVGLGLEVPQPDRAALRGERGGREGGRGGSGMGGSGIGGAGIGNRGVGRGGRAGAMNAEPISFWAQVVLAR